MNPSNYRPDIDGPRAVAVLGVVFFHVGGYLNTKSECSDLINRFGSPAACKAEENVDYYPDGERDEELYERHSSVIDLYIDKRKLLCSDGSLASCATKTPAGVPFAYDKHHLTREFANWIGRLMIEEYPNLLRRGAL